MEMELKTEEKRETNKEMKSIWRKKGTFVMIIIKRNEVKLNIYSLHAQQYN